MIPPASDVRLTGAGCQTCRVAGRQTRCRACRPLSPHWAGVPPPTCSQLARAFGIQHSAFSIHSRREYTTQSKTCQVVHSDNINLSFRPATMTNRAPVFLSRQGCQLICNCLEESGLRGDPVVSWFNGQAWRKFQRAIPQGLKLSARGCEERSYPGMSHGSGPTPKELNPPNLRWIQLLQFRTRSDLVTGRLKGLPRRGTHGVLTP